MSDTLVKVENVSKKFCRSLKRSLWYGVRDIGAELLGRSHHSQNGLPPLRPDEFWALQDVNFELKRGECLGLIGKNGAGKSTLLKMLNGLLKPDTGRIEMRGRIGALIELGTGFNPILTGRENIFINGSVLGFNKQDIDRKLEAIIEFAEIGDFIDMPVKNYSSGMRVRLGFAVAAQMEPDVLLIDEVLAVGDMGFVIKCFNRMDELLQNTSIILVSHNIPQIARMCTNVIVMQNGRMQINSPDVSQGINLYYSLFGQKTGIIIGSEKIELVAVRLQSGSQITSPEDDYLQVPYGSPLKLHVTFKAHAPIHNPIVGLNFYDKTQRGFAEADNFPVGCLIESIAAGQTVTFEATFPNIEFSQGIYSINITFHESDGDTRRHLFRLQQAIYFQVVGIHHGWTPMQFQPEWQLVSEANGDGEAQ